MQESLEILKLRILLCFLSTNEKSHTVTNIAKTLGEEKYTVCRMLKVLENNGLIDRSEKRCPKLTEKGRKKAKYYEERISISLNHLTYEGLDINSAQHDSLYWALYNTENAMQVIRSTEKRYRLKYELREKKRFSGLHLSKKMGDGIYEFPFVFYRENADSSNNLSKANDLFENLCVLKIENGRGLIQLRMVPVKEKAFYKDGNATMKICDAEYFFNGTYIRVEKNGNVFSFPAESLNFINIGSGVGQILHGSVSIKIRCSGNSMTDSKAIFTIFI